MVSVCSFTHADIRGFDDGSGIFGTTGDVGLATVLVGRDTKRTLRRSAPRMSGLDARRWRPSPVLGVGGRAQVGGLDGLFLLSDLIDGGPSFGTGCVHVGSGDTGVGGCVGGAGSSIFSRFMVSIKFNANAFDAACTSENRSASNVSVSTKSSRS